MPWDVKAKSDSGMRIEMELNDTDTSIFELLQLLTRHCTSDPTSKIEITLQKVQDEIP